MSDHRLPTPWGSLAAPGSAGPTGHSYWVVENRLAAGAHPIADDPTGGEGTLVALLEAGISAFVDLTEADVPGSGDAHLGSYRAVASRLVESTVIVSQPIRDMDVPSQAEAAAILDAIDDLLDSERGVYVHCWGGLGRTGTIIGCWLIRHGGADQQSALRALDTLRQGVRGSTHRRSPETDAQRRFVESWCS